MMAGDSSDSDSEFGNLIDQLIAERAQELGVDNQMEEEKKTKGKKKKGQSSPPPRVAMSPEEIRQKLKQHRSASLRALRASRRHKDDSSDDNQPSGSRQPPASEETASSDSDRTPVASPTVLSDRRITQCIPIVRMERAETDKDVNVMDSSEEEGGSSDTGLPSFPKNVASSRFVEEDGNEEEDSDSWDVKDLIEKGSKKVLVLSMQGPRNDGGASSSGAHSYFSRRRHGGHDSSSQQTHSVHSQSVELNNSSDDDIPRKIGRAKRSQSTTLHQSSSDQSSSPAFLNGPPQLPRKRGRPKKGIYSGDKSEDLFFTLSSRNSSPCHTPSRHRPIRPKSQDAQTKHEENSAESENAAPMTRLARSQIVRSEHRSHGESSTDTASNDSTPKIPALSPKRKLRDPVDVSAAKQMRKREHSDSPDRTSSSSKVRSGLQSQLEAPPSLSSASSARLCHVEGPNDHLSTVASEAMPSHLSTLAVDNFHTQTAEDSSLTQTDTKGALSESEVRLWSSAGPSGLSSVKSLETKHVSSDDDDCILMSVSPVIITTESTRHNQLVSINQSANVQVGPQPGGRVGGTPTFNQREKNLPIFLQEVRPSGDKPGGSCEADRSSQPGPSTASQYQNWNDEEDLAALVKFQIPKPSCPPAPPPPPPPGPPPLVSPGGQSWISYIVSKAGERIVLIPISHSGATHPPSASLQTMTSASSAPLQLPYIVAAPSHTVPATIPQPLHSIPAAAAGTFYKLNPPSQPQSSQPSAVQPVGTLPQADLSAVPRTLANQFSGISGYNYITFNPPPAYPVSNMLSTVPHTLTNQSSAVSGHNYATNNPPLPYPVSKTQYGQQEMGIMMPPPPYIGHVNNPPVSQSVTNFGPSQHSAVAVTCHPYPVMHAQSATYSHSVMTTQPVTTSVQSFQLSAAGNGQEQAFKATVPISQLAAATNQSYQLSLPVTNQPIITSFQPSSRAFVQQQTLNNSAKNYRDSHNIPPQLPAAFPASSVQSAVSTTTPASSHQGYAIVEAQSSALPVPVQLTHVASASRQIDNSSSTPFPAVLYANQANASSSSVNVVPVALYAHSSHSRPQPLGQPVPTTAPKPSVLQSSESASQPQLSHIVQSEQARQLITPLSQPDAPQLQYQTECRAYQSAQQPPPQSAQKFSEAELQTIQEQSSSYSKHQGNSSVELQPHATSLRHDPHTVVTQLEEPGPGKKRKRRRGKSLTDNKMESQQQTAVSSQQVSSGKVTNPVCTTAYESLKQRLSSSMPHAKATMITMLQNAGLLCEVNRVAQASPSPPSGMEVTSKIGQLPASSIGQSAGSIEDLTGSEPTGNRQPTTGTFDPQACKEVSSTLQQPRASSSKEGGRESLSVSRGKIWLCPRSAQAALAYNKPLAGEQGYDDSDEEDIVVLADSDSDDDLTITGTFSVPPSPSSVVLPPSTSCLQPPLTSSTSKVHPPLLSDLQPPLLSSSVQSSTPLSSKVQQPPPPSTTSVQSSTPPSSKVQRPPSSSTSVPPQLLSSNVQTSAQPSKVQPPSSTSNVHPSPPPPPPSSSTSSLQLPLPLSRVQPKPSTSKVAPTPSRLPCPVHGHNHVHRPPLKSLDTSVIDLTVDEPAASAENSQATDSDVEIIE